MHFSAELVSRYKNGAVSFAHIIKNTIEYFIGYRHIYTDKWNFQEHRVSKISKFPIELVAYHYMNVITLVDQRVYQFKIAAASF